MFSRVLVLSWLCWKASGAGTREIGLPEHPGLGHLFLPSPWPLPQGTGVWRGA